MESECIDLLIVYMVLLKEKEGKVQSNEWDSARTCNWKHRGDIAHGHPYLFVDHV